MLDENTIQWAVAINDDVKMQWQIDLDFDAYGSDEIDFGTIIRFEATGIMIRSTQLIAKGVRRTTLSIKRILFYTVQTLMA